VGVWEWIDNLFRDVYRVRSIREGGEVWLRILLNSYTWAQKSSDKLQAVVNQVNAVEGGQPRIFFAAPRWNDNNGMFAPNTLLFDISINDPYEPFDSVKERRKAACNAAGLGQAEKEECYRASMGHPNPEGAWAYLRAIEPLLP
jgi:hypothetical protein